MTCGTYRDIESGVVLTCGLDAGHELPHRSGDIAFDFTVSSRPDVDPDEPPRLRRAPMTAPELRRLALVLADRADRLRPDDAQDAADLEDVAAFLDETAAVLERQAQIRREKAAREVISRRRARAQAERRTRTTRRKRNP